MASVHKYFESARARARTHTHIQRWHDTLLAVMSAVLLTRVSLANYNHHALLSQFHLT